MEVLSIKNSKYDRNFQFTNCLFNNTLPFVRIKQISKNRSPKAAIQMCSLKLIFLGKEFKSRENPRKEIVKEFIFW